ncbi:MAG: LCP family protein, partial [Blautia sp.]|nr:LCP family protein [Blautia sp.]
LYAGIDSDGEIEAFDTYGMAPRADSISLVIMDKKHEKMSILSLNRDIMTQIHRYDMYGADDGVYESHLGYAYSYGDGLEFSCENLREAVETLLQIPVDEYFVSNRGSMAFINDLVGGVTVTVPDDDLSADYPEMTKGSRVAITEKNINAFLRSRDTDVDFSNEGRIERQRVYINAYVEKLRGMLPDRTQEIWKELEEKSRYLLTSITKNKYLQFAGLLSTVQYGEDDFYKAPGEDRQGEYHDEFVVDQEALRSLVVNLFYEPA